MPHIQTRSEAPPRRQYPPGAAQALLHALADRGVHVAFHAGELIAYPRALLTDADRAAISELRGDLVFLLAAETEIAEVVGQPVLT